MDPLDAASRTIDHRPGRRVLSIDVSRPKGKHTLLPSCHLADMTFSPLPQPITAGTRFSDPGWMQG